MKLMRQKVICGFLSAVFVMCAPLPAIASDIGIGDDYERLIQYEEAAEKQTQKEEGEKSNRGKKAEKSSRRKRPAGRIRCRRLLLF